MLVAVVLLDCSLSRTDQLSAKVAGVQNPNRSSSAGSSKQRRAPPDLVGLALAEHSSSRGHRNGDDLVTDRERVTGPGAGLADERSASGTTVQMGAR